MKTDRIFAETKEIPSLNPVWELIGISRRILKPIGSVNITDRLLILLPERKDLVPGV